MTHRLAWLERQDVTGRNGRASAIRREAAARGQTASLVYLSFESFSMQDTYSSILSV
jgi:hypothetical protein